MIDDIIAAILSDIVGNAVGVVVDGRSGSTPQRFVWNDAPRGTAAFDAHTQQVWVDALVAAAHVDDGALDDAERAAIERELSSLHTRLPAPLLSRATARAKREDPLAIVVSAVLEMNEETRRRLADAVVAVVTAGRASPARVEVVGAKLREAADLDDAWWKKARSVGAFTAGMMSSSSAHKPAPVAADDAAVTVWFNPACSKCQSVMGILQEAGVDAAEFRYLERAPTRTQLERVLLLLGTDDPRAIARTSEPLWAELGLDDANRDRDAVLAALIEHPVLIERPIIVRGERAVIGRPADRVRELL